MVLNLKFELAAVVKSLNDLHTDQQQCRESGGELTQKAQVFVHYDVITDQVKSECFSIRNFSCYFIFYHMKLAKRENKSRLNRIAIAHIYGV